MIRRDAAPTHRTLRSPAILAAGQQSRARALGAATLIWLMSGMPLTAAFIGYEGWLVLAVGVQALICARARYHPKRVLPLAAAAGAYMIWTFMAWTSGIDAQAMGLLGQLSKIAIVAIPVLFIQNLRRGLIEVMVAICQIALAFFAARQILLLAGVDMASWFQPVYELVNVPNDRTILIFNFDIPQEAGRNSGPFREPGMFAANIVIAALLLFSAKSGYTRAALRKRSAILGLALLTTGSTMGLATIPFLGLLALRYYVVSKATRYVVTPVLVVIVYVAIIAFGVDHLDKARQQTDAVAARTGSWYNTRFGNAYIDQLAVAERPLLGFGFAEQGRPRVFTQYRYSEELGLGNGLTGTAVKHGLLLAATIYALFMWQAIRLYGRKFSGVMAWVTLGLILFSQQLLLMPAIFAMLGVYPRRAVNRASNALRGRQGSVVRRKGVLA